MAVGERLLPTLGDLQMTRAAINHALGGGVGDADAPFPEEMRFYAAHHLEANWRAAKRWVKRECGGRVGAQGPGVSMA